MRIVILGAPGSGKRTQTDLLANNYNLTPVMTGELVKAAVMERSALGLEIKELQDAGRVVTEDIILALLRERLLESEFKGGFVLDGFPRNLLQALTLDELMVEISQPLDLILLIDIETDNLMERLVGRRTCRSCGLLYNVYRNPTVVDGVCDVCGGRLHQRSDDNEETVSSRIHVFDHLISPLITHYEKQGKLVRVDGNGDVEQVFSLICKAIEEGAPRAQRETLPESKATPAETMAEEAETATLQGDEADTRPDNLEPTEAAGENVEAPSAAANATGRGSRKKAASKKSAKKRASPGKTSKKVAPSQKKGKKKAAPKKKTTPKKKAVTKKKTTKKQASKKKLSQKKPSGKQVAKKKAKIRQAAKKKVKTPQKGTMKKSAKVARKKPVKSKKSVAKRTVSSSAKASAGKSKTGRSSSKVAAAKKPVKKAVKKKRVVRKPVKKTVQKKSAVKKPAVKKRAAKKTASKRIKSKKK